MGTRASRMPCAGCARLLRCVRLHRARLVSTGNYRGKVGYDPPCPTQNRAEPGAHPPSPVWTVGVFGLRGHMPPTVPAGIATPPSLGEVPKPGGGRPTRTLPKPVPSVLLDTDRPAPPGPTALRRDAGSSVPRGRAYPVSSAEMVAPMHPGTMHGGGLPCPQRRGGTDTSRPDAWQGEAEQKGDSPVPAWPVSHLPCCQGWGRRRVKCWGP